MSGVFLSAIRLSERSRSHLPAGRPLNPTIQAIAARSRSECRFIAAMATLLLMFAAGCSRPASIVPYEVPTRLPDELRAEPDRMLAAIVPNEGQSWFFKVTGPESAVESLKDDLRSFVESIAFADGEPVLDSLPAGWQRGGESQFRFATLDVTFENKQLNISISKLTHQGDWDAWIKMNVNRWRGQLGLPDSDEKWGDASPLSVATADLPSAWVDIVGTASESRGMAAPPSMPNTRVPSTPDRMVESDQDVPTNPPATTESADDRLSFSRPDGWRDGRMTSMRMAAFDVGPTDAKAELTVIPAGGDLRGNVARWLGQVRGGEVADAVVDQALADAKKITVDGRSAQRFYLTGEDASSGTAIDATIVPLEDGFSLFVKMTGPVGTVTAESDAVAAFLESLKLKL